MDERRRACGLVLYIYIHHRVYVLLGASGRLYASGIVSEDDFQMVLLARPSNSHDSFSLNLRF